MIPEIQKRIADLIVRSGVDDAETLCRALDAPKKIFLLWIEYDEEQQAPYIYACMTVDAARKKAKAWFEEEGYDMPKETCEILSDGTHMKGDRILGSDGHFWEIVQMDVETGEPPMRGEAAEVAAIDEARIFTLPPMPDPETYRGVQRDIWEILVSMKETDIRPNHVEAFMRLEHPTLNGLSRRKFRAEVKVAVACIREGGLEEAEACARSFGLESR